MSYELHPRLQQLNTELMNENLKQSNTLPANISDDNENLANYETTAPRDKPGMFSAAVDGLPEFNGDWSRTPSGAFYKAVGTLRRHLESSPQPRAFKTP